MSKTYREMLERLKTKVTAILSSPILIKTVLSIGKSISMIWFFRYTNLKLKKYNIEHRSSSNASLL